MNGAFLQARLQKRKESGGLRALEVGGDLTDLTSNDYLGFARAPDLIREANRIGATGSRLLTGQCSFYEELEEKIARFHQAESCLIYNSGYTANLGLLAALGTEETTFLYDLEIHASMIDGMRLSRAKQFPFRHNNLELLERRLKQAAPPVFVLVESIYSISGDLAPLCEISALCASYGAELIVDEAHATGLRGPRGEGLAVELGLNAFARIHTFSKALGVHGAAIVGSSLLKEYLVNFSRPFIYATALPFQMLALIECAYDKLAREAAWHRRRLDALIAYFCSKRSGTKTPIQPFAVQGAEEARRLAKRMREARLDARAILPPTAPRGKECLRVVLHSFNREEEIDRFFEVIA